ncbi:MAG TPA: hypothetical protein EYP35_02815 [Desulfobacterales bacterium]|nr:hypothetical protein [Desulfobacterales bacterium]
MTVEKISKRPWLLLPIEVKNREFDAKVMLSCIGAERGFGVLLGRNNFTLRGEFPRGVYLDKCISPYKADALRQQVNGLGNKLAILDEEGLVYQSEKLYLDNRTSRETVDLASLIFTWGNAQRDLINERYNIPDKLIASGSPRADLWQKPWHAVYSDEVRAIQEQLGPYVLIPANFSPAHHVDPINFSLKKRGITEGTCSGKKLSIKEDRFVYRQKILNKFFDLIPAIAEHLENHTILLRPHPNDNMKIWAAIQKKWPQNVKVIYRGGISPWIIATDLLVHNSCTSGVEAYAMEKPAIAYTPYTDSRFDQNIPNPLSQQSNSIQGVLELIDRNLRHKGLGREDEKTEMYNYHITNDRSILSGERILAALEQLGLPEVEFSYQKYGIRRRARVVARKIRRRVGDFTGKHEFSYAYRKQKNPGMTLVEVENLLHCFRNNMNRWHDVNVTQVGEDLFCFYRP